MGHATARDAAFWVAHYERLLQPVGLLIYSRSREDRLLLRRHARRLRARLNYWKGLLS